MKLKYFVLIVALFLITNYLLAQSDKKNHMTVQTHTKVYIGYYLKTLDNLLTEKIDRLHQSNGLTRAEWQILNGIAETPGIKKENLIRSVQEFTDYETAIRLIDGLLRNGKILENSQGLALTANGKALYQRSLKIQQEFRNRSMRGISNEEYNNMIGTLQKMIQNLSIANERVDD